MQIAVGTPVMSGTGHVTVFAVDPRRHARRVHVPGRADRHRGAFGRAMTLVDLDGDGVPDHLLVGAPPTHAYLYSLPLSAGQTPETID